MSEQTSIPSPPKQEERSEIMESGLLRWWQKDDGWMEMALLPTRQREWNHWAYDLLKKDPSQVSAEERALFCSILKNHAALPLLCVTEYHQPARADFPVAINEVASIEVPNISMLQFAAMHNHAWAVKPLLDAGATLDAPQEPANGRMLGSLKLRESQRFSPLGLACLFNASEAAMALIEAGADVEYKQEVVAYEKECYPVFMAAAHNNVPLVEKLVEAGANINRMTSMGTLMHYVCRHATATDLYNLPGYAPDMLDWIISEHKQGRYRNDLLEHPPHSMKLLANCTSIGVKDAPDLDEGIPRDAVTRSNQISILKTLIHCCLEAEEEAQGYTEISGLLNDIMHIDDVALLREILAELPQDWRTPLMQEVVNQLNLLTIHDKEDSSPLFLQAFLERGLDPAAAIPQENENGSEILFPNLLYAVSSYCSPAQFRACIEAGASPFALSCEWLGRPYYLDTLPHMLAEYKTAAEDCLEDKNSYVAENLRYVEGLYKQRFAAIDPVAEHPATLVPDDYQVLWEKFGDPARIKNWFAQNDAYWRNPENAKAACAMFRALPEGCEQRNEYTLLLQRMEQRVTNHVERLANNTAWGAQR